jgi:hypothetical protein
VPECKLTQERLLADCCMYKSGICVLCCLQVSKASTCWKLYVDYVSDIVIEGFGSAITASTHYLLQQLDPEALAR